MSWLGLTQIQIIQQNNIDKSSIKHEFECIKGGTDGCATGCQNSIGLREKSLTDISYFKDIIFKISVKENIFEILWC